MGKLDGKIALVTGASGGIGKAVAIEFAKEGAKGIAVHYGSSEEKALKVVEEIKNLGSDAIAVKADVSKEEEVAAMIDKILKTYGRIDVVAAFAGYPASDWNIDPLELTSDHFDKPWNIDVKGTYFTIKHSAPHMRKQKYGKIIVVSSTPGIVGDSTGLQYTLAKSANRSLVRSLVEKLGPDGIYINAIAPGSVGTEANLKNYSEKQIKEMSKGIPLGRFGEPVEIAKVAVFLASDDSNYVNGQTIVVDGGEITL